MTEYEEYKQTGMLGSYRPERAFPPAASCVT